MNKYTKLLIFFSLIALALRLFLAQFGTYKIDSIIFQLWGTSLVTKGISNFYTNIQSDYLPGYIYVVWFLGKVFYWFFNHGILINPEILYKLPSILTDLANAFLIYLITQKLTTQRKAFLTSLVYLFNPAVMVNSTLWGQVDSFLTFFLLVGFYFLLSGRILLTSLAIGFGLILKPVTIICLPIFLIYLYKKFSLKTVFIFFTITSLTALVTFLSFNSHGNLLGFIIDRFNFTMNQYKYTTLNSFNFWAPISIIFFGNFNLISDSKTIFGITAYNLGHLIFGILYILLLTSLFRKSKIKNYTYFLSFALTLSFIGMFLFLTRMHERHLFYGLTFATLLLPTLPKRGILIVLLLCLNYIINTYFGFHQANNSLSWPFNLIVFLSFLNIFVFIYLFRRFWRFVLKSSKN